MGLATLPSCVCLSLSGQLATVASCFCHSWKEFNGATVHLMLWAASHVSQQSHTSVVQRTTWLDDSNTIGTQPCRLSLGRPVWGGCNWKNSHDGKVAIKSHQCSCLNSHFKQNLHALVWWLPRLQSYTLGVAEQHTSGNNWSYRVGAIKNHIYWWPLNTEVRTEAFYSQTCGCKSY